MIAISKTLRNMSHPPCPTPTYDRLGLLNEDELVQLRTKVQALMDPVYLLSLNGKTPEVATEFEAWRNNLYTSVPEMARMDPAQRKAMNTVLATLKYNTIQRHLRTEKRKREDSPERRPEGTWENYTGSRESSMPGHTESGPPHKKNTQEWSNTGQRIPGQYNGEIAKFAIAQIYRTAEEVDLSEADDDGDPEGQEENSPRTEENDNSLMDRDEPSALRTREQSSYDTPVLSQFEPINTRPEPPPGQIQVQVDKPVEKTSDLNGSTFKTYKALLPLESRSLRPDPNGTPLGSVATVSALSLLAAKASYLDRHPIVLRIPDFEDMQIEFHRLQSPSSAAAILEVSAFIQGENKRGRSWHLFMARLAAHGYDASREVLIYTHPRSRNDIALNNARDFTSMVKAYQRTGNDTIICGSVVATYPPT